MLTGFLRAMDTMRAVLDETRIWTNHLTGEGPTTIRQQRKAVAHNLAAAARAPLARLAPRTERSRHLEVSTARPRPRPRPALGTR
jgi:hypothetical protein